MLIGEFVDTYPPFCDGVGQVVHSFCTALQKRGHRSIYIAPKGLDWDEQTNYETILFNSIKLPKDQYSIGLPWLDIKYTKDIKDYNFDIIHAHSPFVAGKQALLLSEKLSCPLVASFHSKYYDDVLKATNSPHIASGVTKYIINFYEKCDEVWAVSETTAEVLRKYGYKNRIKIMQNGTNPYTIGDESNNKYALDLFGNAKLKLLFVGQINYKKNIHELLKACAILKEKHLDYKMLLIGTGPDVSAVTKEIESLDIGDCVDYIGQISIRDKIMAVYKQADIFVFPSIYDNAPMVVREAAVMGTPSVVVSGSCAAEGIEDNVNGFLCKTKDGADIAQAIIDAQGKTESVGQHAKNTIPVSWDSIIKTVEEAYIRLIEDKKS